MNHDMTRRFNKSHLDGFALSAPGSPVSSNKKKKVLPLVQASFDSGVPRQRVLSDDNRERNYNLSSMTKSLDKSETPYAFDKETMDMIMSGKRFQLKGDHRFTELPELTHFRANKMTDFLKKGLQK